MQKLYLGMSAFYLSIVCSFAQVQEADSSGFKKRKLHLDEVDFFSSYYHQNGNHSAVTGGIGSELLTDYSNLLSVTLLKTDLKNRSHTYGLDFGVDHYTSASSDKIDPATISSASSGDTRIYPSVSWLMRDEAKHHSVGAGASISNEFDYFSRGVNLSASKFSADNNREIGLKLSTFLDTWKVIFPIELREIQTPTGLIPNPDAHGTKPRNTFNASISLQQVINKRFQVALLTDVAYQWGELATLYQRVVFQDNTVRVENLPDNRFKLPIGFRANYFLGDKIVIRSFYRFYTDNWGINAQTIDLEIPYKISPFFSSAPFFRFYTQTAAKYFAPFKQHQITEEFYTSDYDLSEFNSYFSGLNLHFNSADGLLGISKLNTLDLRYGHYSRSDGLRSNSISLVVTVR